MLNIYQLFNIIPHTSENHDALYEIKEAFIKDYRRHYDGLQINNTTRRAAYKLIENGGFGQVFKDEKTAGVYATQTTLYFLPQAADLAYNKTMNMEKTIKDFLQDRRPVDFHMIDTIPTARALGWKPNTTDQKYYIDIDGNYYNYNLIYQALMMICENKKDEPRCELCNINAKHPALMINAKKGSAFILPFIATGAGAVNVDFKHYMETWSRVEDESLGIRREGIA